MAFTKLNEDLDIIAKLDDEPNDVGGLKAEEFKAEFDKAGKIIKLYLNSTLIEELEGENGASSIGIQPIENVNATTVQRAIEVLRSQIAVASRGDLAEGSITDFELGENAVRRQHIKDGEVINSKLAENAVHDENILSVSAEKVIGNISNIEEKSIGTNELKDFCVTKNKLSEGAVTEEKIYSKAVLNRHIGDNAVDERALSDTAVRCKFTNVSISEDSFENNDSDPDYPKRCPIPLRSGTFVADATMVPEVIFSTADAMGGNFAPTAQTYNGGVYIFAAQAASTTIPTIVIWR